MERPRLQTPLVPMTWPDPPTQDFLLQPRRDCDLLAHWEWVLWNKYRKAYEEGEIYKGREGKASQWDTCWKTHARTVWERLSTCTDLTRLCRTKPTRQLHQVLTLLFFFSDMVERKTMDGVFGFKRTKLEDSDQRIKRAKKIAAKLETVRKLVAQIGRAHV